MESVLKLSIGALPPLSARGCIQELVPVTDGTFKRTIDGKLCFVPGMKDMKFRSTISCEDRVPLALNSLAPGQDVVVSCIQVLTQPCDGMATLMRDPVPGSLEALDETGQGMIVTSQTGRDVQIKGKGYVSYRPLLKMQVVKVALKTNEWGLSVGWILELEEI